jgi:outer membrane usher protein
MQRSVAGAACMAVFAVSLQASANGTFKDAAAAAADVATARAESDGGWSVAIGEPELLGVRINEVEQAGEVVAMRLSAHSLAVPVDALAQWRIRLPATARLLMVEGQRHIALDAIPGLHWRIDTASQTLVIDAPSAAFLRNDFEVVSQARPAQSIAGIGGFLNYDLHWERNGAALGGAASQAAGGLFELGAFNAYGNGRTTGVWRHAEGTPAFTRLDTSWNVDMPASLSSVRVGDAIGVAGAWGRSVRFGGVQWATNFAVQPGLVTFPMPAIRGEASVPSIVDLYVNSTHQLQGKVPPGGFDLPDVPVITGAGQIRMVVRDLLGREQVIVQPYYVSPSLLRSGLHDFALEGGNVREDYGIESEQYGRALLVATDRVGITDEFTRELRAEVLRSQQTIGASGVWLVKQLATANLSLAASRSDMGSGALASFGLDHQSNGWSAGVQARVTSRGFTQLGASTTLPGAGPSQSQSQTQRSMVTANFSAAIGNGGFGLTLLQQSTWQGDSYRSLSANYGRSVSALGYMSVFASRTAGSSSGTTVGVNFIQVLGDNGSASVSSSRSRDRAADPSAASQDTRQTVLQLQGNAPVGPGFGYQLQAERGSFERASGDLTWQTEKAAFTAGAAHANGADAFRTGATGGLALMPEGVFAGRRIDGSFAVVQVGDYEGVRIDRDNQFVARTDSRGLAFVGSLRGFENNRISVEAADLPLDAQVDDLQLTVAPGTGSGVSVRFPVKRSIAATLRLVTADGTPVPAGSFVRIGGEKREFPVGFDGKLFLAGLAEHSTIEAQWNDRRCSADIVIARDAEAVPELGTVSCH